MHVSQDALLRVLACMSHDHFGCTLAHGWLKFGPVGSLQGIVITFCFRQLTMVMWSVEPSVAKRQRVSELGEML